MKVPTTHLDILSIDILVEVPKDEESRLIFILHDVVPYFRTHSVVTLPIACAKDDTSMILARYMGRYLGLFVSRFAS
ncbi:hypothetical protein HNR46_000806 [Haloferula luteola]|uniref:Uncharacterized protein n=1 Tax=Haloferula luteola TaxID=595692 RepID=A0A840V755_9BACT|nr:hypothetical protein [Haloferula luteola]MBB5350578.1 hypothetical protein [Haloferula luteola]